MFRRIACVAALCVFSTYLISCGATGDASARHGSFVELRYSLTADGEAVVSPDNLETMKLVIGQGAYPEGFENALVGLKPGDKKVVRLTPENAFGTINPELFIRVKKEQLPPGIQEGALIGSTGENGLPMSMRVLKILEDGTVVLDRNHPLAGRTIVYQVEVVSIS